MVSPPFQNDNPSTPAPLFTMKMLSDTQAEAICGGSGSSEPLTTPSQPFPRPSFSRSPFAGSGGWGRSALALSGRFGVLNVIQILFSPQINISLVFAINGSTAIGGNQTNAVLARFA